MVVAAAGNDRAKASTNVPANCPGVVTVAGLARDGSMAWYSNHGERVTLSAPGGSLRERGADDIVSTVDAGKRGRERPIFAYHAGTSMAAPQVAALVALMRSADPVIGVDDVTRQLVDNARPLPGPCPEGLRRGPDGCRRDRRRGGRGSRAALRRRGARPSAQMASKRFASRFLRTVAGSHTRPFMAM